MEANERILEILKESLNRWVEETKDKVRNESETYKGVLEYIESLEYDYKGKINNISSTTEQDK